MPDLTPLPLPLPLRMAAVARRVLSGDEIGLSLKAAAALYVAGVLGRIATPVGLLFIGARMRART